MKKNSQNPEKKHAKNHNFLLQNSTLKNFKSLRGPRFWIFFLFIKFRRFLVVFWNPKNGKKPHIFALKEGVPFCIGFGRVFWCFFLGFWGWTLVEKALKKRKGALLKMSVSPTRDSDFRGSGVRKKRRKPLKRRKKWWVFRRGKRIWAAQAQTTKEICECEQQTATCWFKQTKNFIPRKVFWY